MRVNPDPYPDLLNAVNQVEQEINTDEEQIATGYSVNVPSDNPTAAAVLVENAAQTWQVDQYQRSIGSVQAEMQDANSTLSSVVTSLQQAITLGTEGANGTLDASDRQSIVVQVQGIQSQLLSLANLSYQGNYVFAGTATQTKPYVPDASSPSGVTYQGNNDTNSVTLGSNFTLQTNLPGLQVFSSAGGDMFQSINDLINGLDSGNTTSIGNAVVEVGNALNSIDGQRVFYGNALNELSSQTNYLSSETTSLAQREDTVGGADLSADISNLTTAQTSVTATLQSISDTAHTNLFEYLR
jgi:flagellar hook-associated protein 3 FlgL